MQRMDIPETDSEAVIGAKLLTQSVNSSFDPKLLNMDEVSTPDALSMGDDDRASA